jgi:Tfp pilus assembly protein PilO
VSFEDFSIWVTAHQTLITLVMLPCIFFVMTHWIAYRTDKNAEKDRGKERKLNQQMRLAEVQYESLKSLRTDIAGLISSLRNWRLTNEPRHEAVTHSFHQVLMQLNGKNKNHEKFI